MNTLISWNSVKRLMTLASANPTNSLPVGTSRIVILAPWQ